MFTRHVWCLPLVHGSPAAPLPAPLAVASLPQSDHLSCEQQYGSSEFFWLQKCGGLATFVGKGASYERKGVSGSPRLGQVTIGGGGTSVSCTPFQVPYLNHSKVVTQSLGNPHGGVFHQVSSGQRSPHELKPNLHCYADRMEQLYTAVDASMARHITAHRHQ
jgi:hypothetical protein